MSVRRNSLYNSMPWTIWGGPIAFGGLGVGYKEKYRLLLGVSAESQSWLRLGLMGITFGGGGPITFGAFCAIPTSHGIPSLRA